MKTKRDMYSCKTCFYYTPNRGQACPICRRECRERVAEYEAEMNVPPWLRLAIAMGISAVAVAAAIELIRSQIGGI